MTSKRPILTVGKLRAFLAQVEKHHGISLDEHPVHIMDLDRATDTEPEDVVNLATDVEIDRFDPDSMQDVVSIFKWQEKP